MRKLAIIVILLVSMNLTGCATMGYYWQAVNGQWDVMQRRQPIDRLLRDDTTPETLKARLRMAAEMRRFASVELKLPDNASYTSYADLGREAVVWNVFAAPAFSLQLKEWCFPVAGCVQYHGYFSEAGARAFAASLREAGYDVFVGGVAAYSTLGWFDDPLLNTVIGGDDAELAALIFHELAHQKVYIKGDTLFNESFAVAVEQAGVARWLDRYGNPGSRASYERRIQRQAHVIGLVIAARYRLQTLYNNQPAPAGRDKAKAEILAGLREDYASLKREWDGFAGYDAWFDQELNNASLAAVSAYHDYVPLFTQLLQAHGGDFAAFYRAANTLAGLSPERRLQALQEMPAIRLAGD